MGDAVDPVQGAGELANGGSEAEQADHSVDVDEEDRPLGVCLVRYQGVVLRVCGKAFELKRQARGPIARRERLGTPPIYPTESPT